MPYYVVVILIGLLAPISISAQVIIKIVDSAKGPIQWATVLWNEGGGRVTNEEGVVIISSYDEIRDSVKISSVGYIGVTLLKKNITNNSTHLVTLTEDVVALPIVQVGNGKKKIEKIYGCPFSKGKKVNFINNLTERLELGVKISGYPDESSLKSISVYISKKSGEQLPFRFKIYENRNDFPGKPVLNENVIIKTYKTGQWNTFDLEEKNILLPDNSFFVGIEWLVPDKNEKQLAIGGAKWPNQGQYVSFGNSRFGRSFNNLFDPMINVRIISYQP